MHFALQKTWNCYYIVMTSYQIFNNMQRWQKYKYTCSGKQGEFPCLRVTFISNLVQKRAVLSAVMPCCIRWLFDFTRDDCNTVRDRVNQKTISYNIEYPTTVTHFIERFRLGFILDYPYQVYQRALMIW